MLWGLPALAMLRARQHASHEWALSMCDRRLRQKFVQGMIMKKLSSLMVLPVLLCGLAFAQYDRRDDNQHDRRDNNQYDDHRHDGGRDERITNGPVVERVGNTWATVAWSTNTGGSSVVRYGRDPNHLDRRAQAPYAVDKGRPGETHRVKIDHLRPGTTYYYVVDSGQGQGTGTEARSRVEQFTTRR